MNKTIAVAAAIILKDNQVLIAKRPLDKHKGGYWEFPGGKIEARESAEQALAREIQEELSLQINAPIHYQDVTFDYAEKQVQLKFYKVTKFSGFPQGLEGQEVRWVNLADLSKYQFPEANQVIVTKLISEFS